MRRNKYGLLLCLPLCSAFGLPNDHQQSIHFQADHVTYHGPQKTTEYAGHVQAKQGSSTLRAERVIVYQNTAHNIVRLVATGHPARYTTQTKSDQPPVYISGDTLRYLPQRNKLYIQGHGRVKQAQNTLVGARLWYDIQRDAVHTMPTAKQRQTWVVLETRKPNARPLQLGVQPHKKKVQS